MLLLLTACFEEDKHPDLTRFISQVNSSAKATATALPPEPHYEPIPFKPAVSLDPFVLPASLQQKSKMSGNCWQPELIPEIEPLENYELNSLLFKGVIGNAGSYWALIETPDKSIHRIGVGRMIGSNRGRVDSISSQTLSITEHIPDGLGCWQVRNTRMALTNYKNG